MKDELFWLWCLLLGIATGASWYRVWSLTRKIRVGERLLARVQGGNVIHRTTREVLWSCPDCDYETEYELYDRDRHRCGRQGPDSPTWPNACSHGVALTSPCAACRVSVGNGGRP